MYYTGFYDSPIGKLTLATDDDVLVGLWVEGQKYYGGSTPAMIQGAQYEAVFKPFKKWLDLYFVGKEPPLSALSVAPVGGEFRQIVWKLLCEIPYGETTTYGTLAKKTAALLNKKNMAGQAIGNAVGHNPISIIIPCHRVVGTTGSLTGYASGIRRKLFLLELEGVDLSGFFIPDKGTAL
ncbi:MAG: methylated-DNA--[protein]-cysteine S-methyltransferase [Candidatus Hydrogenedentes bacterium]|nr:methylated-DNA--[protein]-cysteine S-methyltransferase [Candidatus Hydrogenedentota bacterium]